MINQKISGKQVSSIMILFILGSSLVTGGSMKAKQDSWLSIIIAVVISIPIILIYARMNKLKPDKDFFDMAYIALGKVGGAIVTFLFSIYAIHLGILVLRNFTEYIHVVSFPETPQIYVAICICLIMYFTVRGGIEILGRGNVFILPLVIFVIVLLILLSIKNMDFNNLKPIYYNNYKPVLSEAYSLFSFPFCETVLFITVFASVDTKENPSKIYLLAILFSGLIILIIALWNILVLGFPLSKIIFFPLYSTAGIIEVGSFFSRIEVLISGSFIICGLVKSTICLFVGCKGIAKLFNISDHKKTAAPIAAVMAIASILIFKNTMQMLKFSEIYILIEPFFEIVLPLLVLIILEIKIKKQKVGEKKKGTCIDKQ